MADYQSLVPILSLRTPQVLHCEHGDPAMFESFWKPQRNHHIFVSHADSLMSYFVEKPFGELTGPWYVHEELDDAIREIHGFVGNAITWDKKIVVGNGSTQLLQAALFALASKEPAAPPAAVVAQSPYYSGYPIMANYLQSQLLYWAGDAFTFQAEKDQLFIEFVTSPNNPCGSMREKAVWGDYGYVVHDLAYYWPQYTPIVEALDHNIMIFTLSKSTGHAGLRLGWAIVKDPSVAKKMAKFIENATIGVCRDAQVRAAGLLRATIKGYTWSSRTSPTYHSWNATDLLANRKFFHLGMVMLAERWAKVRSALAANPMFTLPPPSQPARCSFLQVDFPNHPAFLWIKCEMEDADCHAILESNGIRSRRGESFGASAQYARVSLIGNEDTMDHLIARLRTLKIDPSHTRTVSMVADSAQ